MIDELRYRVEIVLASALMLAVFGAAKIVAGALDVWLVLTSQENEK